MAAGVGNGYKHWECFDLRDGDFLAMLEEPLAFKKGDLLPLYCPARLVARDGGVLVARVLSNVEHLSYAVFDYDRGDAGLDELVARATALGLRAMAHRSPSDGTTLSKILRHKGAPGSVQSEREIVAPTVAACTEHLIAEGYDPKLLGPITIVEPARVEKQIVRVKKEDGEWESVEVINTYIIVRHLPLSKSRLILGLSEPFKREPGECNRKFAERWGDGVLKPVADQLGFQSDSKCCDPTRAFYLPSSLTPSAVPEDQITRFVPGEPLDLSGPKMASWRKSYEGSKRQRQAEQRARTKAATLNRKGLGNVESVRYALADLLADKCSDRIRNDLRREKDGLLEAECPFDHLHTNAGDPRDTGFFVTNAGVACCHHGHGDAHKAADFIAQMLADGWFTADELGQYALPALRAGQVRPDRDWHRIALGIE
jgi:hypothetical protein